MFRSIHILLTVVAGLLALIWFAWSGAGAAWWWASIAAYFAMACLGTTVTFHRYWAHRSFEFRWPWLRYLFTILGTLAASGSVIGWVAVHKAHHRHSDAPGDPHGPVRGWRNFAPDYDDAVNYRFVRSLMRDPFLRWLHLNGLTVVAAFWGALFLLGGAEALAFLGLIPQAATGVIAAVSNWFTHKGVGYRNFATKDDSANVWWLALPTWGEAWHNNHHAKPDRYSFKARWWEVDISGMVINVLSSKENWRSP